MFHWQGTQTFFSRWNAKSQILSLVCTLRISNIAITSLVCTRRNSKCATKIIIQITRFALVWKQSLSLNRACKFVQYIVRHWVKIDICLYTINRNSLWNGPSWQVNTCQNVGWVFKVYLYPENIIWYVKGTQIRSPLHQHSVKNIHQVMK